jgi:methylase of polypeptide subunit release factors
MALDGGPDGLDPTCVLLIQAHGLLAEHGTLLIEIYSDNAAEVEVLAKRAFPRTRVNIHDDLLGLARVLEIGPVSRQSTSVLPATESN